MVSYNIPNCHYYSHRLRLSQRVGLFKLIQELWDNKLRVKIEMSVKVGVRVRPFNQRENDLNCRLCIEMKGPMTRLFDADEPDKHRDFTFDYSFWSHDRFTPNQKGYFEADDEKYAEQRHVFQKVGLEILTNAWEGYHCCLFAYGQTGSGKSYSMVGYGANKGIVPISCQQIFNRIGKNDNPIKQYEVNVSMLEIYNEKVQDLLIPMNKRIKEGLKIREHKTLGIYVQGLSKHFVDNYIAVETKMDEGSRNRSIAATQMNANSSRAHTIISIEFKQIEIIQNRKRQKLSVIYLVDLAGSEKVGKTGATGDRLKEAAGINKSLSVLGLVISTLADKAMGKGKGVVPYRDSCLTRILQNALGGNSKTLMICAISPATDNYEETLSTLRYADQAKKIQNKAVVNESETDKMIRNLTAEKEELRDKVAKFEEMFKKLGLQLNQQMLEQFNDAKEQLKFNDQMMKDYNTSPQEKKMIEQKEREEELKNKIDMTQPHLSNLNEDPQLSRRIHYSIGKPRSTIGRRNIEPPNDIEIGGMGIRPLHAIMEMNEEGQIFLDPKFSGEDSGCYLNGTIVLEKTQIMNMDRICFCSNNIFVVSVPDGKPREDVDNKAIDWQYAQNELYLKKEKAEQEIIQERERKIKEETASMLRQKEQQLALLQKHLQESQQQRKHMEAQKEIQKAELEKKKMKEQEESLKKKIEEDKKKIEDSKTQQQQKIKEKYYFEKKLLKTLPKCIELNLIAKQFKRNISMSVKMLLPNSQGEEDDIDLKKRSIKVKVVNREVGYSYWWDTVKLSNRYYIIKDMAQQYFETGTIPTLDEKDDPFWDPPEHTLIGRAFLTTKALAYMFDNPVNLTIIGEDDHCGELTVNLVPTDETGTKNLSQQMDQEVQFEPEQLIDKPFYFNLIIEAAKIPENYENIYVDYTLKTNQVHSQTFKTNEISERRTDPQFDYVRLHQFDVLTKSLLTYLNTAKLIFRVYGYEMLPEEKKQIKKSTLPLGQSPKRPEDTPDIEKAKNESQTKNIVIGTKQPKEVNKERPPIVASKLDSKVTTSTSLNTGASNNGAKRTSNLKPEPSKMATAQKTATQAKKPSDIKKKETTDKEKDCIIY